MNDPQSAPAILSVVLLALATALSSTSGAPKGEEQAEALKLHNRLIDEFSELDPDHSGWESEAFSEEITKEMKKVADLLINPAELTSAKMRPLIARDFVCSPLQFGELVAINDNPALIVGKPAQNSPEEEKSYRGPEGIVTTFKHLGSELQGARYPRAKFKVMHVEMKDDHILSRLLFELRGKKVTGWTQITSTWECEWTRSSPPRLRRISVSNYRKASPGKNARIEFFDTAPAVLASTDSYRKQLFRSFDYWRARSDKSLVADLLGAQGIAIGDVNGDLLDDLYVLQPGGLPNRLFLHQADGTAQDISAESGADVLDFCRSALLIDLDGDSDLDLALGLAWSVHLMENDGKGRFTSRGTIKSEGQINSMAAADYDNDGDLDLYLCGRDASGAIKAEQGALGIPMPYYDANNGGPNSLLRNEGAFTFANVTSEVGMEVNNRRFSLACAWADFDNDGDQDLYVANDFGRNNLFRNDPGPKPGERRFTDIAPQAGVLDIGPGMSAAWGDYNQDGLPDLYVANMWSNAGNRITLQKQFLPSGNAKIRAQARRHARGNSVYLNRGDGTFEDITATSGANMARWAWSSNFIDLDNDGHRDLVVANGMITTADSGDL